MPAADAIEPYVRALSERFSCALEPFRAGVGLVVDDDQRLSVRFGDAEATIATPVAGAHDGLPASILRELLRRNFPDGRLAGATIAARRDQDYLELVNVLPYTAVDPAALAAVAAAQAAAATGLARRVAEESRRLLQPETEGNR